MAETDAQLPTRRTYRPRGTARGRLHVRVADDLLAWLSDEANKTGKPQAELVEGALRRARTRSQFWERQR